MVSSSVQTYEYNVPEPKQIRPAFNTDHYIPEKSYTIGHHHTSPNIRALDHSRLEGKPNYLIDYPFTNELCHHRNPTHFFLFEGKLNDSRDEVKELRHRLRERDEAYSRQNAEIAILKRQLREQEREMSRVRRLQGKPAYQAVAAPTGDADIAINLQDGDHDDYGKIDQARLYILSSASTASTKTIITIET